MIIETFYILYSIDYNTIADKELLKKFGIQVKPESEQYLDKITNKQAVQSSIDSSFKGEVKNTILLCAGFYSFVDGIADCGAEILRKVYDVASTRDFSLYSVIELFAGIGLLVYSTKSRAKKEARLENLATKLNKHYVKD